MYKPDIFNLLFLENIILLFYFCFFFFEELKYISAIFKADIV